MWRICSWWMPWTAASPAMCSAGGNLWLKREGIWEVPMTGGLKFTNTMKLSYLSGPGDFRLKAPASQGETLVIYSKYDGPFNKAFYETLPVEDGYICIRQDPNLAMACVCNRHGLNQRTVVPIRNFGITEGAIATTVSHDCHKPDHDIPGPGGCMDCGGDLKEKRRGHSCGSQWKGAGKPGPSGCRG